MSAMLNTTNEAEGLPRRRFTFEEVEQMTRLGIFLEDERFELIGGEIVPMSPKGSFHERMKSALNLYWAQRLPDDLLFTTETTFRLSRDTYLEPDFVFYPKAGGWNGLSAGTARLVVEISDSSLAYDLGRKAKLYAGFGISELWVINATSRATRIHRDPAPDGYGHIDDRGPDDRLAPVLDPDLSVILSVARSPLIAGDRTEAIPSMSFFKRLFGGGATAETGPAKPAAEIEHEGFTIRAEPFKGEGGQFQTAGTVLKEIDGVLKEHRFIRADRFASLDDATEFSLTKGRQLVNEQKERMFR